MMLLSSVPIDPRQVSLWQVFLVGVIFGISESITTQIFTMLLQALKRRLSRCRHQP